MSVFKEGERLVAVEWHMPSLAGTVEFVRDVDDITIEVRYEDGLVCQVFWAFWVQESARAQIVALLEEVASRREALGRWEAGRLNELSRIRREAAGR